ncbi:Coenzyme F420-reducing hydrogenase, beta subunit [Ruminococcus sp. YE71]|uniref:Coenzyme F420 hydrogenase/dehydrogenase, beta subunit C-terminal domain n=1 Tax=unclassified Ruminococcus TaxID=2608920 RepID=UPI000891B482|nr:MULTISPECIES: Coenzyme F420 hydrogenase/dehydrogenase, beta subunit C-terminal domain [unclassified Ruminococcus]SDA30682.1 Coenzyme F420-reducing hydrogenase, beta subunit [Ruminococcus sp. YE78]SFW49894.1 Coenzyme F420-reducing hydrogenase, beta subunit [Ruminococcus sp. YE71]
MDILERVKKDCCGCSACMNACPRSCITMKPDSEGFLYPSVDEDKCVGCDKCAKVCPVLNSGRPDNQPKAYLVRNRDASLRKSSTSGGFFAAAAEYVLEQGGCVFGVGFDENFAVRHSFIESMDDIKKFNRSKYVQSEVGFSYRKVKEFLESGRKVLFTGTPCQVEGLLNYLGRDYDGLYTMDIICKGVPSPKFWSKYLAWQKKKSGKDIREVRFREKTYGYGSTTMRVVYSDGTEYDEPYDVDPMLQFYSKEMISRPSCYNCHVKGKHRRSSFTVGDYWYVSGAAPEMDDGIGVSQVLVNNEKAAAAFENIRKHLDTVQLDFDKDSAINGGMMVASAKPSPRRDEMFADLDKMSVGELQRKYFPSTFKLKNSIKRQIRPLMYKTGVLKMYKKRMRKKQSEQGSRQNAAPMKRVSVYTRGFTHAASYYRILQYTEKLGNVRITNRFTVTDKMFRRYSDSPTLLCKIEYHLMIFFRNLWNFSRDIIEKPDTVVISRAAVPKVCVFPIDLMYEHILKNSKVVWDFDDDIFGINEITRAESLLLRRYSDKVIVTSDYLKNMLGKRCRKKVSLLPTTDGDFRIADKTSLNVKRQSTFAEQINVLWVGSSSGLKHIRNVVSALDNAAKEVREKTGKKLTLTVICNLPLEAETKYLEIKNILWARDIVLDEMLKAHIGIMPLLNIKRSMGKGGFKLVQYMAVGLPSVASDVGINNTVVADGETGVIVDDKENTDGWVDAVLKLSLDYNEWEAYSRASLKKWEEDFSFDRNLDFWQKTLSE